MKGTFSVVNGFVKNVIILGVDMSSSEYVDNKKKYILIFGEGLYYNGENSYLFVHGIEIHKFKTKDSEINTIPLCLGNISKDFSVDNTKKTGFYEICL